MVRLINLLVLGVLCQAAAGVKRPQDAYIAKWFRLFGEIAAAPELRPALYEDPAVGGKDFVFPEPIFECDVQKSPTPPRTVHELRPGDIDVVAAMGDSVTAAFGVGAESVLDVLTQNRGESWSVGGEDTLEEGVITLANVLRQFNPELKGYSRCSSDQNSPKAGLNVAVGGATCVEMPGQAEHLVAKVTEDADIDLEQDWKLVTLLIGGNDLCAACTNDAYSATNYALRISEALDILQAGLPRTIVNLVPMFDISPLAEFEGLICSIAHLFICQCGVDNQYRNETSIRQRDYYNNLKALVDSGKYDSDTFTVVLQPVLVDLTPPIDPDSDTGKFDRTFLSLDCFHPSRKAHQGFAYVLWQSMLHPVGEKPLTWDWYDPRPVYRCPTQEHPYVFTSGNSGQQSIKNRHFERENEV